MALEKVEKVVIPALVYITTLRRITGKLSRRGGGLEDWTCRKYCRVSNDHSRVHRCLEKNGDEAGTFILETQIGRFRILVRA
eukprot:12027806-Ditylum_brightwellii.AAC.1